MPALPGATMTTRSAAGTSPAPRAMRQASACSRAPLPMMRTRAMSVDPPAPPLTTSSLEREVERLARGAATAVAHHDPAVGGAVVGERVVFVAGRRRVLDL